MLPNSITDKVKKAFEDPFVGNTILFEENELNQIYQEVGKILNGVFLDNESIKPDNYELVVFALIELTREWDADGEALYAFLARKLLGQYGEFDNKVQEKIRECIKSLRADNKMYTLPIQKQYYATLCSHALSPSVSLFFFFDICWGIYCEDLSQQYQSNDPILERIARSFENKLSSATSDSDEANIIIGSETYRLRIGITGLVRYQTEFLIKLLDLVLFSIDCIFNSRPMANKTHLERLISNWWSQKEEKFGLNKEKKKTRYETAKSYKQIRPKYILEDGIAKLIIPQFRLEDNSDCPPQLKIYINGSLISNDYIPTKGTMLSTTKEREFDLNSFNFDSKIRIRVEIIHQDKIIYTSNETLNRDFLIFDENREVNSEVLIPKDYFLYAPNIGELTTPENISKQEGKWLYFITAEEGDEISSSRTKVFFSEKQGKKEAVFTYREAKNVRFRKNEKLFFIIEKEIYLNIDSIISVDNIGIKFGSTHKRLALLPFKKIENRHQYDVSAFIKKGEPTTITVFNYADNSVLTSKDIILFDKIKIEFDSDIYYGANTIGVFNFEADNYTCVSNFSISQKEFCDDFLDGLIVFEPPILRWRFDNKEWNCMPTNAIYYKKIANSSILEIDAPLEMELEVGVSNNKYLERKENSLKFKVGEFLHSQDEKAIDVLTLFISMPNQKYEITQIFLKQKIVGDPFYVNSNEKIIAWNPDAFVGEEGSYLLLEIYNICNPRKEPFRTPLNMASRQNHQFKTLEDDYYNVKIVMIDNSFIGAKRIELYEKEIIFGDIKRIRFKGNDIRITDAKFFDVKGLFPMRPVNVSDIEYLQTIDGLACYSGILFLINKNGGRIDLDYMRDSKNKWIKINPIRIEMKTLTECYIGYGLDLEDDAFDYDGEFVITRDGKISINNKETACNNVDYFKFEIVKKVRKSNV